MEAKVGDGEVEEQVKKVKPERREETREKSKLAQVRKIERERNEAYRLKRSSHDQRPNILR